MGIVLLVVAFVFFVLALHRSSQGPTGGIGLHYAPPVGRIH